MSEFFEIFNPGARFQRQQRDLDKTYVMQQKKGGRGPLGIDLDAGTMVIKPRSAAAHVPTQPVPPPTQAAPQAEGEDVGDHRTGDTPSPGEQPEN